MNSYIGKTCPYCQFPIKQKSEAVYCKSCNIPHHRDCWQENKGCTTFGCKETKVKEQARDRINVTIEQPVRNRSVAPSSGTNSYLVLALVVSVILIIVLLMSPAHGPGNQVPSASTQQTAQQTSTQSTGQSEQPATSQTTQQATEVIYYVITEQGSNLFIRKSPGRDNKSSSDIITKVPRGTQFHIINNHGNSVKKDGFTWWEIRVVKSGITGWVAAEYISTNSRAVKK